MFHMFTNLIIFPPLQPPWQAMWMNCVWPLVFFIYYYLFIIWETLSYWSSLVSLHVALITCMFLAHPNMVGATVVIKCDEQSFRPKICTNKTNIYQTNLLQVIWKIKLIFGPVLDTQNSYFCEFGRGGW